VSASCYHRSPLPKECEPLPKLLAAFVGILPVLAAAAGGAQPTPGARPAMLQLGESLVFGPFSSDPIANPSPGSHVLRADRGSKRGQFVEVRTSPSPSGGRAGETEYRLVAPANAGSLPAVDVLGIHYVKVRPGQEAAFDKFVGDRIHPAVGSLRPDLRILYYKAVRGGQPGDYIALFALTQESRDKYWPKGADSDALRAAFSPEIRGLAGELRAYLVEGSYAADPKLAAAVYESRDWTDLVVVPPQAR
jgi:hypothetical protein